MSAPTRLSALIATLLVAGCATTPSGPDSQATPVGATPWITIGPGMSAEPLRTFPLAPPNAGNERACPAYGVTNPVEGTLAGDRSDPERVWLVGPSGRISVVWPAGYTLVFEPEAALYDGAGRIFARAGDTVDLGQVWVTSHAGTPADPYLAAGLIGAGPANGSGRIDCVPAADGEPYPSP
jgi:hypothetical protein